MTTSESDFDLFVTGPIIGGDVTKTMRLWKAEYVSARRCGGTALHWACGWTKGDNEGVVRSLLTLGCDIEAECDGDYSGWWKGGWTPLHVCALSSNQSAMGVLLEAQQCSLTSVTPIGETPLYIAEACENHMCASMLRTAIQTKEMSNLFKLMRHAYFTNILESQTLERLDTPKISENMGWRGARGGTALKTTTKKITKKEVGETVSNQLELLKNNSLSKIMNPETGKSLLEILLNGKDQRVLEAIKTKEVNEQEVNEWMSLNISQIYPRSIHECLMFRCIHQNYDRGVYSLCTADVVNRASLFMGPTALETAVNCGAGVWVHEILKKLVKVEKSWSTAKSIAKKKNLLDIQEMITKRKDYLIRKNKKGISRLHIAVIENDPDMIEYLIKNNLATADKSHKNLGTSLNLAYNIDNNDCVQSLQAWNANVNTVDRNKSEDLHKYLSDNTIIVHSQVSQTSEVAEVEPENICNICEDELKNCAFNCGHMLCMTCAEKTIDCYVCRRRIIYRTKLFV